MTPTLRYEPIEPHTHECGHKCYRRAEPEHERDVRCSACEATNPPDRLPIPRGPHNLPEDIDYRDDGCDIAPACLDCPLDDCVLNDASQAYRLSVRKRRHEQIWRWKRAGTPAREISRKMNLSMRTVYRDIEVGPPEDRPFDEDPEGLDAEPLAASDLRPSWKERAPLPEIRPGFSGLRPIYSEGVMS